MEDTYVIRLGPSPFPSHVFGIRSLLLRQMDHFSIIFRVLSSSETNSYITNLKTEFTVPLSESRMRCIHYGGAQNPQFRCLLTANRIVPLPSLILPFTRDILLCFLSSCDFKFIGPFLPPPVFSLLPVNQSTVSPNPLRLVYKGTSVTT